MSKDREIVDGFLARCPEARGEIERACYAYNKGHGEKGAHYFAGTHREAACRWCGQTREGVRWDWYGSPPDCQERPAHMDQPIESIIAKEEALFERVVERAEKVAAGLDVETVTGEDLARLHHTHGVDPSMLEVVLMQQGRCLPQEKHDSYQQAYEKHKEKGRKGLVRPVIVGRTYEPA